MFASTVARATRSRAWTIRTFAAVGDQLPAIELFYTFPPKKVNLAEYAADKSIVLLGLPGAFTPTQIPNYLEHQGALRKAGVDSVIVWAVNDSAVMQAWSKDQKIGLSMLKFMGDPAGKLTEALDMKITHPGPATDKGLIGRCKRHAIYAVNGVIKAVLVSESEDDPAGDNDPSHTLAPAVLEAISTSK